MNAKECNGTTLAYIGDAVMSLWVRERQVQEGCQKPAILQRRSIAWVSARAQAHFLAVLMQKAFFSEAEMDIVRRGRNAKSVSNAKNASVQDYRMATGLEAVIGYLYLSKQEERLQTLWAEIQEIGEQK